MDASRLLLIFVVISTSECSGPAEPQCLNHTEQLFRLLEGESFYVVPYDLVDNEQLEDKEITWSKNKLEISSAENRIHYHGKMLFFLNLRTEDSGFYSGRYVSSSGHCRNYYVRIEVFKASHRSDNKLLYGKVENSDENQRIRCPDPVMDTCDYLGGNFTWYKDFTLLQSEHKDHLWVKKATKDHEGIYTCNCTWEHNNKIYYSSGSRRLIVKDRGAYRGLEILSPSRKEQFEDEGSESKLNCSVFCGTNIQQDCSASWHVNGVPFNWTHGYNQTTKTVTEKPSL
uniref:interleukin-1 receptor type 1-like n=1 Tax=Monopterus albus TaxID=43700 RepID=UPI0009B3EE45